MIAKCPFSHLYRIAEQASDSVRPRLLEFIDELQASNLVELHKGTRATSFQVKLPQDRGVEHDPVGNHPHVMRVFVRGDGGVTLFAYWGTHLAVKNRFWSLLPDKSGIKLDADGSHGKHLKTLLVDMPASRIVGLLEQVAQDVGATRS